MGGGSGCEWEAGTRPARNWWYDLALFCVVPAFPVRDELGGDLTSMPESSRLLDGATRASLRPKSMQLCASRLECATPSALAPSYRIRQSLLLAPAVLTSLRPIDERPEDIYSHLNRSHPSLQSAHQRRSNKLRRTDSCLAAFPQFALRRDPADVTGAWHSFAPKRSSSVSEFPSQMISHSLPRTPQPAEMTSFRTIQTTSAKHLLDTLTLPAKPEARRRSADVTASNR